MSEFNDNIFSKAIASSASIELGFPLPQLKKSKCFLTVYDLGPVQAGNEQGSFTYGTKFLAKMRKILFASLKFLKFYFVFKRLFFMKEIVT